MRDPLFSISLRLFAFWLWPVLGLAQLDYNGGTITQSFDSLPATGTFTLTTTSAALTTAPINAAGLAGWSISQITGSAVIKFRVDAGGSNTSSHLSCGTGTQTDRALGLLASSSYVGRCGVVLINNTGGPLTQFTVSYTGEQWRNGGSGAANTLNFAYAVGTTNIDSGSFTAVTALDFTSPVSSTTSSALDGNATANRVAITATVSGVPWNVGQTLVLRWSDKDDTGFDDSLAIDDLSFSAIQSPVTTITRLHDVQGSGESSPMTGAQVTVEGVVTGDFQGSTPALGGFYLQEIGANMDADPLTSEGIFVNNAGAIQVAVGDFVQVTGTVSEVSGVTTLTSPTFVLKSGTSSVPVPVVVALPADLERYEGMLVRFNQTLTITSNENLGLHGELSLASNGPVEAPTEQIDPNDMIASGTDSATTIGNTNVAAITAQASLNQRRAIVLDDASKKTYPDPTPFTNAQQTRRCGDTVTGLTGFLSTDSGASRLEPLGNVTFVDANPRTSSPPAVGGRLRVAALNAHNYFITLGSRGASTTEEFTRQQDKLVAEIIGLNADIVGFMEIENNGTAALDTLIGAVNSALGSIVYAHVPEPAAGTGGDLIRVAMMYKAAVVTPTGISYSDANSVWNRQPLAVPFTEASTGAKFVVCLNHFKSKTPQNASGANLDQGDGQGAYNYERKQQAGRLLVFLTSVRSSTAIDNVLILGDLNAYSQEDPLDVIRAGGYADQSAILAPGSYSYAFDGARGHLDHALASPSMAGQITGLTNWHINADEPSFLDESLANKSAAQQAINIGTPYRASDHDPVLLGLALTPPPITYSAWAATINWPVGADASPTGDADHDGMSNLEELLYDAQSTVPDASLRPVLNVSGSILQFDYRLKHTVTDYTVVPQWSNDLVHWFDMSSNTLADLTLTMVLKRASQDVTNEPRCFVRLDMR